MYILIGLFILWINESCTGVLFPSLVLTESPIWISSIAFQESSDINTSVPTKKHFANPPDAHPAATVAPALNIWLKGLFAACDPCISAVIPIADIWLANACCWAELAPANIP